MELPTEILDMITMYTGELRVAKALKRYISEYVYDRLEKNILIYGEVQGGKTKEIIKILREYTDKPRVLVLQNSLLVLKQYIERLKKENIKFQIVDKKTDKLDDRVTILINNVKRYEYFKRINKNKRYILILDEADLVYKNCELEGYKTFHCTATPFYKGNTILFDSIIKVQRHKDYCGIENLKVKEEKDTYKAVIRFMGEPKGVMLINRYTLVKEMQEWGKGISHRYPNVPVVVLNSEKVIYMKKKRKVLGKKSITKIIDDLKEHSHIILIADRLANRGLSYVSSDYSRHLTHQVTRIKDNRVTFMQSLRILGVYNNKPDLKLTLVVDNEKRYRKHFNFYRDFDVDGLRK